MKNGPGAAAEWRKYGMLPIVAAIGNATSVIHVYGFGPYLEPVAAEFGWSRTFITTGLSLATAIQALLAIPIGLMIDKFGPRRLAVPGIVFACGAFALLGTASGGTANWYVLWILLAFAILLVQAPVWTAAVASRFDASRGLALAVTICGSSLAAMVFPLLATWLTKSYGWRTAFLAHGAIWAAIAFPLVLLFFRGANDRRPGEPPVEDDGTIGISFPEGLRSSVYLRLLGACFLYTFTMLGLVVHFIPILVDSGADRLAAAGYAAIIGIASLIGRLGTGFLLDRFESSRIGGSVFLLPAVGCILLLLADSSPALQIGAAIAFGLTLGAEVDVIVYLTTRYFGLKSFGALFGGLMVALSLGTATGPLSAARVYDITGSYNLFLGATIALALLSSLALFSLPRRYPGDSG